MAKVDKVENKEAVVEKKVDKKSKKSSQVDVIFKKKLISGTYFLKISFMKLE